MHAYSKHFSGQFEIRIGNVTFNRGKTLLLYCIAECRDNSSLSKAFTREKRHPNKLHSLKLARNETEKMKR